MLTTYVTAKTTEPLSPEALARVLAALSAALQAEGASPAGVYAEQIDKPR